MNFFIVFKVWLTHIFNINWGAANVVFGASTWQETILIWSVTSHLISSIPSGRGLVNPVTSTGNSHRWLNVSAVLIASCKRWWTGCFGVLGRGLGVVVLGRGAWGGLEGGLFTRHTFNEKWDVTFLAGVGIRENKNQNRNQRLHSRQSQIWFLETSLPCAIFLAVGSRWHYHMRFALHWIQIPLTPIVVYRGGLSKVNWQTQMSQNSRIPINIEFLLSCRKIKRFAASSKPESGWHSEWNLCTRMLK